MTDPIDRLEDAGADSSGQTPRYDRPGPDLARELGTDPPGSAGRPDDGTAPTSTPGTPTGGADTDMAGEPTGGDLEDR